MQASRWIVGLVTLAALAVMCARLTGEPSWKVTEAGVPVEIDGGATFVVKKISIGPHECEMRLVFFDTKTHDLRVVEQVVAQRKLAKSIADIAKDFGAVAVCNGGYFDMKTWEPVGLEIASGRRGADFSNGELTAVLAFRGGTGDIVSGRNFKDAPDITEALQCWPMLADGGNALKFESSPKNVRTFVATDGADRWVIGTATSLSLRDLADMLVDPAIITELRVSAAMNLDGGPSTGLWCADAQGAVHYQKEKWTVRNMLVVIKKK